MDVFSRILQEHVDSGEIAGASARITHKGKDLFRGAAGYDDIEKNRPFALEGLMCIFSLTKMVIGVAALKLLEQGCFLLDDPVYKYIPAYKDTTVLSYTEGIKPTVRPTKNVVTIRHLFTMTAGFPYPTVGIMPEMPRRYIDAAMMIGEVFRNSREQAEKSGEALTTLKAAELIASSPMCFEPGEGWLYGHCSDILGAVVSVISGKSLAEFIRDEILLPLGMKDTTYIPDAQQRARTATIYDYSDPSNIKPFDINATVPDRLLSTPTGELEICSSSLYSTLDDYSRFIQMLANGGSLDGARILGRKTVELMISDHLTPLQHDEFRRTWFPQGYASWGLMVCITKTLNNAGMMRFPGSFGWSGAAGTVAWADPTENLSVTFMTQRLPSESEKIVSKLMQAAYSMI